MHSTTNQDYLFQFLIIALPLAAFIVSGSLEIASFEEVALLPATYANNTVTVTLRDGLNQYAGTSDTDIRAGSSNINNGNMKTLKSAGNVHLLFGFKIFQSEGGIIPNDVIIDSAILQIHKNSSSDGVYEARRILKNWKELEATWNNAAVGLPWSVAGAGGIDTDMAASADGQGSIDTNPGWLSIDVTAGVQMFTSSANYGWRVARIGGSTLAKYFDSSEALDQTLRPKLIITYHGGTLPPQISLSVNPTTIAVGESAMITWSVTDALSCTASGDWSGEKALSGAESTGVLTLRRTYTYTLICTGTGTTVQSASLSVIDPIPPSVSVISPLSNTTVPRTLMLEADATDNLGTTTVQFQVNGINVGPKDPLAPYKVLWDTTIFPQGDATITAIATDDSGNTATSTPVVVNIPLRITPPGATGMNVVFILTDDQRAGTIDEMPTLAGKFPNIQNELVAKGVKFTNGFVTTPLCCPSRASILTGQFAHTHGVKGNSSGARKFQPKDSDTLATRLQNAGYRTGIFGKYLNDYKFISPYIAPGWGKWEVFKNEGYTRYDLITDGVESAETQYATEKLAEDAVSFIQSAGSAPLFLYFAPYVPHSPLPAPQDAGAFFDFPDWRPPSYNEADVSDKPLWVQNHSLISGTGMDGTHKRQLRTLLQVDRAVGKIITALIETGRIDNTLFIFLGDNGFMWGEHRLSGKSCAYEECIRVPFIIRAPGVQPRQDASFTLNIDLMPTILAFAGLAAPQSVEGISLYNLLTNVTSSVRTDFLFEGWDGSSNTFSGVHTATSTYVKYTNGDEELYDLVNDPYQMESQHANPLYAEAKTYLRMRLNQFLGN